MRLAFILLLATNIALVVWGLMASRAGQLEPRPQPGGDLVLVQTESQTDSLSCFQLRPAPGPGFAQHLTRRLAGEGFQVEQFYSGATRQYWVYVAPRESLDEARGLLEQLRLAAVHGASMATRSKWTNAVSLGFYDDEDAATARRDAIRSLGFDAQIEERPNAGYNGELRVYAKSAPTAVRGYRWTEGVCDR